MELVKLTNSMRRCFAKCKRAYMYNYVQLRRSAESAECLRFGTMVHSALEAWWLAAPEKRLAPAIAALDGDKECDPFDKAKASALITGYDAMWGAQTYRTVSAETGFEAPLMNPETGANSKTYMLAGKIDAIAEDADGKMLIIEHKTTSDSVDADSDYWKKLSIDGQVSGYYLGASALGIDARDCVYDVIHKPGLKPYKATPADKVKLKKDGTPYAGTRLSDETPEEYGARVMEDIQANPAKYFARRSVMRTKSDLTDYLYDMWAVGRDIADAERLGRYQRNPDACAMMVRCEYFPVCSGVASIDDDALYRTAAKTNEEL